MRDPFDDYFNEVLVHEGGYVNDPADRGGETNYGITAATARAAGYNGSMKDIPIEKVKDIYRKEYWLKIKGPELSRLHPDITSELFKAAVNCGVTRASKWFQRTTNLFIKDSNELIAVDGVIGPKTIAAFDKASEFELHTNAESYIINDAFLHYVGGHYIGLAERNPSQKKFIKGWLNRIA